jgi:hypothetical protein
MAEKLVVGPINRGQRTDREPFAIDNDSFPILLNAYQWRGRIKRKRGTSPLGRLTRFFNSAISSYGSISSFNLVAGAGNLITGFSLQSNANIVPGSVNITVAGNTYTDPASNGILVGAPGGSGTINYASGAITIAGGAGNAVTGNFRYYPDLPVMGLEDIVLTTQAYPGTIAFDIKFAYNILTTSPYSIYSISFYKNASSSGFLPGYTPKTTWTATSWNGQDYQQFWTTNYQGAFWATNGINVPFNIANIGMQFANSTLISYIGNTANTITVTITGSPLVIGDFVFFNEWTGANAINLNFQTGYVTGIVGPNITITFPNATLGAGPYTPGMIQYLTNRSDVTKDCIRWYDGDPTNQNPTAPNFVQGNGWVNFMPPLSRSIYSIAGTPPAQYYLVGARIIQEFKDRLLFIGPVIQTSSSSAQPIYLPDTVIFSQNGTPFYTSSFTGDPSLSTTLFNPVLTPVNQTSFAAAWWEDQTGFGGFISAGIDQTILTCGVIQDVLILGAPTVQMQFVYSGDGIAPFNFFLIDSDLSTGSTFSMINMGNGVFTRGDRGIINTSQSKAERIDLDILDQVMEMDLTQNGAERITAQRDYINEWNYLTFPSNQNTYKFPTQTLQYNYREQSWAVFDESYTHYGKFRKSTGYTWATIGSVYPTWSSWTAPWNAGSTTLEAPEVIAGNQQGFVVFRDEGTNEANSLYIQNISGNTITSPDHCLNEGDYVVISGILGTLSSINGKIFSVGSNPTQNTFVLNPTISSGTYLGGGLIKRMYVPYIQTKQFPAGWSIGRKTRIGMQQYLISTTPKGQIQLLIFLSQNAAQAFNDGNIVPQVGGVDNSGLIYSTVLYTCPESTNLGLTPFNTNLLMNSPGGVTGSQQLWHRIGTSLIGDTIQLGFTMSDAQMRDTNFNNQFVEIEIHGFNIDISPSQLLC